MFSDIIFEIIERSNAVFNSVLMYILSNESSFSNIVFEENQIRWTDLLIILQQFKLMLKRY